MNFPFFNAIRVTPQLSSNIEVGFSQFGPTLAISGQLKTDNRVFFVKNIILKVFGKKSGAEHLFKWFAFRPPNFQARNFSHLESKPPSKFMITSKHPYKFNILFTDQDKYSRMKDTLSEIKREWQKTIELFSFNSIVDQYETLFMDFLKKEKVIESLHTLEDMSYWKEEAFRTEMHIIAEDKSRYEIEKTFKLTADDAQALNQNPSIIIADLCKQANIRYLFSNPKLL